MMPKSDIIYLKHIRNAISKILDYTEDITEEGFLSNQLVKDAVVRNFEIIGEASKQVSETTRLAHSELEWKKMAGMRDS